MGKSHLLGWNMAHECTLYAERRCAALRDEPYPMAHPKHMRVDSQGALAKSKSFYNVGRLTPYTRQTGQLLCSLRNCVCKLFMHHSGYALQIFSLTVGITHRADVLKDLFDRSLCHGLRRWIVGKQMLSDHVYPLVGALCRKHGGNEELKRSFVVKFRIHAPELSLKCGKHLDKTFL